MATDFFERQDAARRSTAWLIGMFVAAVLAMTAVVFLLVASLVAADRQRGPDSLTPRGSYPWQVPLGAAAGTLAVIGLGSLYKVAALRAGGGRSVAEGLAGRRLLHENATETSHKRLLNVVDEMAIASGVPAPPVFLLDDPAINAFAAGYSPSDAVIGVTQGCVDGLTRDELQGVVAHEFSHILNGDMRMSIRLIGVLHGILLLGLIGQMILRTMFYSGAHYDSRQNDSDSGKGGSGVLVAMAIAIALIVIGSIGSFMGGLIKAAVSRQREYLADASAVQFTRNPGGITGALKRILGVSQGSRLSHPRAAELSHMYFSQGVWEGFTSLMATHPPLANRIRAIEPSWDGAVPDATVDRAAALPEAAAGFAGGAERAEPVTSESIDAAVEQIGDPIDEHRRYAADLIGRIPEEVRAAAGGPSGARAVVYGLLLDRNAEVRRVQHEALAEMADPAVVALLFRRLAPLIDTLQPESRLPLIDLCLPSLAAMSFPQYQRFVRSFRALVVADDRLSLFEWTLSQVLLRHLRPQFERVRSPRVTHRSLYPLSKECGVLLSTIAYACDSEADVADAYGQGRSVIKEAPPEIMSREGCTLDAFRAALEQIAGVAEQHKGRLVAAAAEVVCADQTVEVAEAELLRGVADLLDCPMPPLLPGQRVSR